MAYAKFDDGFADHPKVRGLSDAAFRLHVAGILHCARWRASHVHPDDVRRLVRDYRASAITELVESGLWIADDAGWRVRRPAPRGRRRHIPRTLRRMVFARDGDKCQVCGTDRRLTVDHLHPYIYGGTDDLDNLRTLCHSCNARRGAARLTDDELRGGI